MKSLTKPKLIAVCLTLLGLFCFASNDDYKQTVANEPYVVEIINSAIESALVERKDDWQVVALQEAP